MVEINLLPWRETVRKKQVHQIILLYFMGVIFLLIFFLSYYCYLSSQIQHHAQNYQMLLSRIAHTRPASKVDHKVSLKHHSVLMALFNLCSFMHEKIYLSELMSHQKKITMLGIAETPKELKQFMSKIVSIKNIDFVTLTSLESTEDGLKFNLFAMEI